MVDLSELPSLTPAHFFALAVECHRGGGADLKKALPKKCRLPDTTELCGEEGFAQVSMAWDEGGVTINVASAAPFTTPVVPEYGRGDSIELFFDTRDIKSAGVTSRFCHHFVCLPHAVGEAPQMQEVTRFRSEEVHERCNPIDLIVAVDPKGGGEGCISSVKIFIPSHCLFGYDPQQFDRLGFTYRISRRGGAPQHFSASSSEFPVDQKPALWSSLRLVDYENSHSR